MLALTKGNYDKECKICTRPSKSSGGDLVVMQDTRKVRDTALSINSNDAIPKSDLNKEYFAEEHDRRARAGLD
nr:hypothetical protein [Tanacetum cinerariifolium]